MRKNATKLAAAVLSLAMVMTSVSMPASAATTKKAKLNKTSATLFTNGTKSQKGTTLYVTVGGKKVKATFKSSNTKVLTVGKTTGKVKAKKKGTATVKATYKKKTYSCKITVKTYVTSLSVSAKTVNLVKGKTATIKTTVKPSTASNKKVSFKSSNTSVATVTSSGKVTAKKKGSATITVTALGSRKDSKKATVKVNVTEPTVTPTETPVVTETPVPTETPSVATEGTITISSNVTGASIKVLNGAEVVTTATGSELDKTVITGKIPYGTYDVVISKDGYEPVTKNVTVNSNNVSVDATLTEVEKLEVSSISAVNATGEKTALNGATVSRSASFEMKFNKEVDEETITNSTIKLVKGSETMAISLPTINNEVIAFKSLSVLDADAEYKVVVDGIKSKDGKDTLTNTTIATFKSAKTVVAKKVTVDKLKTEEGGTTSTTIYDATTNDGVLLNVSGGWDYTPDTQNESNGSTINVKFDTPVDKSTINSKSIQLIDVTTGKNIAVEGNQVNYTDALIIKVVGSKDYLTPKHQYKLLLDGLKAANGMDIDTFSVTFAYQAGKPASVGAEETSIYNGDLKDIKTARGVDKLVNPLTTSKMLDDGKTFKAAAAVIVDFGAANIKLDESTVTTDYLFIREKDTQKRVAQTISYNKELNRVTLTPSERLKDDTDYEIFESPYIKNIYGVTLGTKDSEYATYPFKTLDVTAPTVVGQPESTLENKSLSKLPIDTVTKINIKMSENIGEISPTTAAKAFATGTGNVLVTRADDEEKSVTVSNDLAKNGIITVKKEVIGRDTYIQLTVDPTKVPKKVEENGTITLEDNPKEKGSYIKDNIKGKTFRVTLAGTNPTRANLSEKVITDQAPEVVNAMANDYSFTFTFEGEDKTAPKITDIKASNGGDLESINGMTNVDLSKPVRVYFDCTDVAGSPENIKNIKLVDKDNKEYYAEVYKENGKIEPTGNTSYVDVKFKASDNAEAKDVQSAFTLKAQGIVDGNNNESSLQTYNFIAGTGLSVKTAIFDKPAGSTSEDSYVKITFDKPEDVDVTTLAGNITLKNGDKEIPATIDSSKLTDAKEGNCIKVIPTEKLAGNTTYTLVVGKNVKNNDGNLLQQNGSDAAPADYKINITTDDDAKPAIVGEPTYKDGKLTITFNTEIKEITTDSLKITDSRNSEPTIDGEAKVNGDNKKIVEITVVDKNLDDENVVKLDKGVQYNVKLEVKANNKGGENKDGAVSTVTTSFVPDKDFTTEQKKDVESSVKAQVYKTSGTAGEYGSTADSLVEGSIDDIDAKFTIEFDQNVSIDAVKAMKFKDPATGTEYSTDVKVLDGEYDKDTTKYAKKFAIDISGMFDKAIEFKATLAKGTSVGSDAAGTNVSKTDKDINFVIKLIPTKTGA